MKSKNSIPRSLQGILWSSRVERLDKKKDKIYIIHQVLMYGNLKQIRWLFQTYSRADIRRAFLEHPQKIYTPAAFNFVKKFILRIKKPCPHSKYYAHLPRRLRS